MKLRRVGSGRVFRLAEYVCLDVRGALVSEDGPQGPADDDSARKVALNGRERVGGCGGLQEEAGG